MDPQQKETLLMELYEDVGFATLIRPREMLAYIVDHYLVPGHKLEVMLAITESRLAQWKATNSGKSTEDCQTYHEEALKMLEELQRVGGGDVGQADGVDLLLQEVEQVLAKAIDSLPLTDYSVEDKVTLHEERAMVRYRLGKYDQALGDVAVAYHYARGTGQGDELELKQLAIECMFGAEQVDDVERAQEVVDQLVQGDSDIEHLVRLSLHEACTRPNQLYNNGFSLAGERYVDPSFRYLLDHRVTLKGDADGRHAIARESINADTILLVEKPTSAVLMAYRLPFTCSYCLRELGAEELSYPCDYCREVRFCSLHCSVEAYQHFHRFECGFLGLLLRQLGDSAVHAYRTIRQVGLEVALSYHPLTYTVEHYLRNKALRGKANYALTDDDKLELYKCLCSLPAGPPAFASEMAFKAVQAVDLALVLLAAEQEVLQEGAYELRDTFLVVLHLCYSHLERLSVNALRVHPDDECDSAINLHGDEKHTESQKITCQMLAGSIFQRSSQPNVKWHFQDGHIIFKTITPVAAGKEFTIAADDNI